MKKLWIASLLMGCAFSVQAETTTAEEDSGLVFVDPEADFAKDTAYYKEHKKEAHAIVVLLAGFNADNDGIHQAFEKRAEGDVSKWKKIVDKLNSARDYENKLEAFSYFQSCRNAAISADLAWSSAASMSRDLSEWDNPKSFNLQQYQNAKKSFKEEYADCKHKVNTPPKKKA